MTFEIRSIASAPSMDSMVNSANPVSRKYARLRRIAEGLRQAGYRHAASLADKEAMLMWDKLPMEDRW